MIQINKIQFTPSGMKIKFSLSSSEPDIDARMDIETADIAWSDQFFFSLEKVRQGTEKIIFGDKVAAERLKRNDTTEALEEFLQTAFDSIVFGLDEVGRFAKITMSASLRYYAEVGSLKLPKAYYDVSGSRPSLFPAEEREDVKALVAETERMVAAYLYRVGTVAHQMSAGGGSCLSLVSQGEASAPAFSGGALHG